MNKNIYLDHSATTYVDPEVKKAMEPYFCKEFGNPSSFHSIGLRAKEALENSRTKVAKLINAKPNEIIFTGSGTESCNLAIQGVARAMKKIKNIKKQKRDKLHIITTNMEHHAVLDTCEYLEKENKENFEVTFVRVEKNGIVDPKKIENEIRKNTILISVMYANNEIGTINPVAEIGKIARKHKVFFHTDACQAGCYLDLDVEKLNIDLMSLNGSKIYGPKGIGCLYKKSNNPNVSIEPIIFGGGQEFGLRAGTQNIPGIVGFVKALELAQKNRVKESKRLIKLRDKLIKNLLSKIPRCQLNGDPKKRLPNNVNISFSEVEGESLLLHLDKKGVYASSGSACTSEQLEPSHVLIGIGVPFEIAHGSLRFTLGKRNTEEDINYVIKVLPEIVQTLRTISPFKPKK